MIPYGIERQVMPGVCSVWGVQPTTTETTMERIGSKLAGTIWTRNLILFAVAHFMARFGQGLLSGARMNFFVDTLGLSGG